MIRGQPDWLWSICCLMKKPDSPHKSQNHKKLISHLNYLWLKKIKALSFLQLLTLLLSGYFVRTGVSGGGQIWPPLDFQFGVNFWPVWQFVLKGLVYLSKNTKGQTYSPKNHQFIDILNLSESHDFCQFCDSRIVKIPGFSSSNLHKIWTNHQNHPKPFLSCQADQSRKSQAGSIHSKPIFMKKNSENR